ncbi:hypothetical protein Tco_0999059, partial [Tanacetum coccineum]
MWGYELTLVMHSKEYTSNGFNTKVGEESREGHNSLGDDSNPKLSPFRWDKLRAPSDRVKSEICGICGRSVVSTEVFLSSELQSCKGLGPQFVNPGDEVENMGDEENIFVSLLGDDDALLFTVRSLSRPDCSRH